MTMTRPQELWVDSVPNPLTLPSTKIARLRGQFSKYMAMKSAKGIVPNISDPSVLQDMAKVSDLVRQKGSIYTWQDISKVTSQKLGIKKDSLYQPRLTGDTAKWRKKLLNSLINNLS